jgi:hypothetical protein
MPTIKLYNQRVFVISGLLSDKSKGLFKSSLPSTLPKNSITVFADYALAEFPIGEQFTRVFSIHNFEIWSETLCEIIAVTQQFNKPMDAVPIGWKTVCVLRFLNSIPELITSLPLSDSDIWGEPASRIGLCDTETWEQLLKETNDAQA